MATAVLQAHGIEAATRSLALADARQQLAGGAIEAMFVSAPVDGSGLEDLDELGIRFIPITGRAVEQLLTDFPFWRAAVVRPRGGPGPIATVGGVNAFVCSKDLDAHTVYQFTKSFFDLLPTLSSDLGLRPLDADSASATPVPLHEGAARYYRERETLR